MKYRKKPVEIEAIQFLGTQESANEMLSQFNIEGAHFVPEKTNPTIGEIKIPTLEGTMTASGGDFIIKGVKGEFYPCKPDIFKQSYSLEKE